MVEERRRALRALLRHPLLTRAGPDPAAFGLVRRHAGWLREWLATNAGWSLQVDTGLARLRKLPGRLEDRTRPALAEPARTPFSRRRYVLACLALAALERADAQVTLGWLADRVLALAADPGLADAGFSFALDSREQRGDLVVVARLLLRIQVLAKVAGDEQSFVDASGDALYDVNRRVLAALLVTQRGPSTVAAADLEARLQAITEELVPDSDDGRNRAIRHALARRLLDDPVLYHDELTEPERAYLTRQRGFLVQRVSEATGLVAEVRAEGVAMLDPSSEATDLAMPEEGTEGHGTLLLAEHLAALAREHPGVPVPVAALEARMAALAAEHAAHWRKGSADPGAAAALCRLAIARLEALGLLRRGGGAMTAAGNGHRPHLDGQDRHPGDRSGGLPLPGHERWQPLRAGLVDLFLYDDEEFRFRDGHLLLRGNNGTGKSKVLALMLPFLLDGELAPHRVEPDADPGKRMEWNLLLGGRYQERLGYTWLELGRLAEDGSPAYLTLGCGLKAVAGRGIAARWFFVTTRRVGVDLRLVSQVGTALVRDRLVEALGDSGRVFDHAEAYRRAVDEHLFHLGPERYDALVNLLIQLRAPQLSKRPDADKLSRALSQALGPVDQAVLADVAESFHDLEQQRDELRGLQETRGHVERFLGRYRHYAHIAARRQAAELRAAQSAYEATNRQLVAVRHDLVGAREAEAATAAALELSERDLGAARAAVQELAAAPEIQRLDRAEELARLARAAADRTRRLHDDAERLRDRRETDRDRAAAAASASRAAVTAAVEASGLAADAAGTRRDHDALLAPLALPDGGGEPSAGVEEAALGRVRNAVAATADRREQAIGHVRALAERATGAAGRLAAEHRRLNDLAAERDQAAEHRRDAEEAVAEEARALVDAWRRYAAALTEVRLEQEHPPAGLDGILADLEDWTGTLAGASPARAALAAAAGTTRNRLAEARATALSQLGAAATALEALVEQRERLERGEHEQPPAPYTRPAGVRDGRAGAPLWQVVDFREGVGDGERAGLEAALEAAGLLDAWVAPDGRLLAPGTHDVVVTAGTPATQNLAAVLAPAIDRDDPQAAALSEAAVGAVLAGIGLGPGPGGEGDAGTWVEPNGRWRLGVAEGAWAKPTARFVGRGAREAARRQRLADLAGEIASAEAVVGTAETARDAVEARQRALDAELARVPDEQPLRDAHAAVTAAAADLVQREERVMAQEAAVAVAAAAARTAGEDRDQAAADLSLPTALGALQEVRDALGAYRAAVATLWPEARGHGDRLRGLHAAAAELAEAATDARSRAEEARSTAAEAHAAERRRDTLRDSIGATVAELLAKLEATKAEVAHLEGESKRLGREHLALTKQVGNAEGQEQQLAAKLDEDTGRRGAAAAA